ncbi:hypothetical protein [Devosia sp.]|uniref:hypothetical protein n=1 Tax=Devosia sp. TaxID=1871048 RepID=UPI003267F013
MHTGWRVWIGAGRQMHQSIDAGKRCGDLVMGIVDGGQISGDISAVADVEADTAGKGAHHLLADVTQRAGDQQAHG